MNDPQNDPDFWTKVLFGPYVDKDGVEFVIVENQDGECYAVDMEDPL